MEQVAGRADISPLHHTAVPLPRGSRAEEALSGSIPPGYEAFYQEQFKRVVKYVCMRAGDTGAEQAAEDATQFAMIQLAAHWNRAGEMNREGWVRRTAWRAFRKEIRRDADFVRKALSGGHLADAAPDCSDDLAARDVVDSVLAKLPPAQREILQGIVEGLTPSEIAEALGKKPATVRSNLAAVRKRFAAEIPNSREDRNQDDEDGEADR